MTKGSVRRPYTVFVAVIAVIVFGVISYLRMTPDLLPNMDFPYVVVVTMYPGAAPEEVETVVTKPMEQSMATLNDIKTVTSSSAENYSLVVLEFEQETNMDSAMVEILQSVQLLSGAWDETVGTPAIIRINPNMIPVMVAAVDSADMDRYQMARFAQETLIPRLEGTTGLASVTAGGLIERTLTVRLSDAKMDWTNRRIRAAIEESLKEAREQLEEAQREIDDSLAQVEAGTAQLQNPSFDISDDLRDQAGDLEDLFGDVQETTAQLAAAYAARDALEQQLAETESALAELNAQYGSYETQLSSLRADRDLFSSVTGPGFDELPGATSLRDEGLGLPEDLIAALEARGCYTLEAARLQLTLTEAQITAVEAQRDATGAAVAAYQAQAEQLRQQLDELNALIERLESESEAQQEELEALQEQLAQLPTQLMTGISQISLAGGQLAVAQASLAAAQQQITQAVTTLEEQLAAALKNSDVKAILTIPTVTSIIRAQNFDMPAGYVYDEKGNEVLVTVGEGIRSVDELRHLPLFDLGIETLEPILLADVADFVRSDNGGEIYATLNGNDGLLLMFSKQSGYATATVSDNLKANFAALEAQYPGVTFTPLMDQGDYIYLIRDSILSSLGWGVVFSVIVLFLFLQDWRPTVITLLSIPVSLMATLTAMYFAGVSVNMMSLSGLAISVGMLVDNSVVVIENTYRLRSLGENSVRSAVSGARQVGGAVAASTLTTICVFLPIAFLTGITRELFTDMILTLSFALVASLVIALTLVPAMASLLLEKSKTPKAGFFTRFAGRYRKSVLWAVDHKAVVLLLALALLLGSGAVVLGRGYNFLPEMEMEQMMVTLTMPEGSSFAETAEMADAAVERMLTVDGVETVGGSIARSTGFDVSSLSEEGDVTFYVLLESRGPKASAVAAEINRVCADLPCEVNADANSMMSSMTEAMSGSGITLRVYSNDLDKLRETGDLLAERLAQVEGVVSASAGTEDPTSEIHFIVDKAAAAGHGLTVAQVYMAVSDALTGRAELMELRDGRNTYTVFVETRSDDDLTPSYAEGIEIAVTEKDGTETQVPITDVASVQHTHSLASISRIDQRRYLEVTGEIAEGYNVTKVTDRAEELLRGFDRDEDVEISFSGERESIMEALRQLLLLLLVGILLVYLVMVAQFQNLRAPFIVLFTVPLAFTGGFLALLLCGMEINLLSMLGMIMLVGIIVNNGIVLVDYINQLRLSGMPRREAIAEAAQTRLRPILMTSITTILGLFVMALGRSEATSLIQPLAVTCIGGLLYATLMTLFVVPAMYDVFSRRELYAVAQEDLVLSEK